MRRGGVVNDGRGQQEVEYGLRKPAAVLEAEVRLSEEFHALKAGAQHGDQLLRVKAGVRARLVAKAAAQARPVVLQVPGELLPGGSVERSQIAHPARTVGDAQV